MSTKATIYYDEETDTHLFEEVSIDDKFTSPAYITSKWFKIDIEEFKGSIGASSITLEIPDAVMDKLAVEWCKKRKLHGHLGGPVGREYGSPDSEY